MTAPRRRAFAGALALLATSLLLPARALAQLRPSAAEIAVDTLEGRDVLSVRFPGAVAFSAPVLQAAVETSAGSCDNPALFLVCPLGVGVTRQSFDPEALRADVLRLRLFYFQRGYRDIKVEADAKPLGAGVEATFRLSEGKPVRVASLEIAGADSVRGVDLGDDLPLRPGDPLNMLLYEAARDSLASRLLDRGYAHAQVLANYFIPSDTPQAAHVRFDVVPGPLARFGRIQVIGATRVSPRVVRRMLTFHRGDVYSRDQVLKSQRNLFTLEAFRHVEIHPDLDADPDTVVPVVVQVNESDLHHVRVGAGVSTADAITAEARWTSRNFLGGARRLELRAQVGNVLAPQLESVPWFDTGDGEFGKLTGALGADFQQPWFFSPLNTFGGGLFIERQSYNEVYVRTSRGAYLTLTHTLGPRTSVAVGFRPELTRLDTDQGDVFFCQQLASCALGDIRVLSASHWLAPLTASLVRDRSNSLFAPTRGSILRLDGEFASRATGSDFSYVRLQGELSEYRGLPGGLVLAARLRPGWARSLGEPSDHDVLGLHPQKRFFAGGPNSVRGFAQYRLGPKVLTVLDPVGSLATPRDGQPARCTPAEINGGTCDAHGLPADAFEPHPVGGAALLEGSLELRFPLGLPKLRGATFVDFGQVWSTPGEARLKSLVWTPGFGVRYFSAIGPIRVDIGYNPEGAELLPVLVRGVGIEDATTGQCVDPPADVDPTKLRACQPQLHALVTPVSWQPRDRFLDHLQLHFSIGQAF